MFNDQWKKWVQNFTKGVQATNKAKTSKLDIYTNTNNWQFSSNGELAIEIFDAIRKR
jgi:hypothetical protein